MNASNPKCYRFEAFILLQPLPLLHNNSAAAFTAFLRHRPTYVRPFQCDGASKLLIRTKL